MKALLVFGAALATAWPTPARSAPSPPPPPFAVNQYSTGTQIRPSVQALSDGGFAVVWTSAFQDGFGLGVFGRVFDDTGQASGSEFQVNTFTTCYQFAPSVGATGTGFVVSWQSGPSFSPCTQDGSGFGVFARVFDGTGAAVSGELQVNTYTTNGQANARVTGDASGFVVVWDSDLQDGDGTGVFARLFAADGSNAGTEFRVSDQTAGDQYTPAVSKLADDGFMVVWLDAQAGDGAVDVFGRRFDVSGAATGSELRLNEPLAIDRQAARVVRSGDGAVALWSARNQQSSFDVVGTRLDADGAPVGKAFQVNTYTSGRQQLGSVAASEDGFVVVWTSLDQDSDSTGVFGRRMGADARAVGPEFAASAYTVGEQSDPAVAALPDGGFVVAWSSPADASEYAIVAARFDAEHVLAECGDADAGGTITARDALLALRAAMSADSCPLRTCDVDNDTTITATDALAILRAALGISTTLECPT